MVQNLFHHLIFVIYFCVISKLIYFEGVTNITVHTCIFLFNLSTIWALQKHSPLFLPWIGEPCHRKLKLQRFDIVFLFFFFCKAGCSSYLWSSTWDKDSTISAQLAEDYFPKVKACISLTALSTDFHQCVRSLLSLYIHSKYKQLCTAHWEHQGPLAEMTRGTFALMITLK